MDGQTARDLLRAEHLRLVETKLGLAAELPPASDPEVVPAEQPADLGASVTERQVDQALLRAIDEDLWNVEEALSRLDLGTYGLCLACGAAIGDERLAAVPATRFCHLHEEASEIPLEAAVPGDSSEPAAAGELARVEAQQHLDLIPDDDAIEPDPYARDEDEDRGAEDAAVHTRPL